MLQRLFTSGELDYCFAGKLPAPHLAARFAAKEAIIKALSSLGEKKPAYRDIEIQNNPDGVPLVTVRKPGLTGLRIHLSLSHCEDKAVAFTVITGTVN
jgi:holo-[acyl-carrier protein] synthase